MSTKKPTTRRKPLGGVGGRTTAPRKMVLMDAKAIIQEWPMTPPVRAACIVRLTRVVTHGVDERAIVAAAKALLAADSHNLAIRLAERGQPPVSPVTLNFDLSNLRGLSDEDLARTIAALQAGTSPKG